MVGRLLCLALIISSGALSALAQIGSQGQISGFVIDQNGAAVSNATVVVTDKGTGQQRTAQTDSGGYYVVANLNPGTYDVSVEQSGFKKFVQSDVKLDAAARQTVDIKLEIGSVSETVTVTESATQIQSSTAQVGRLIEGQQVRDLALNGRNPIFLQMLKAGVLGGSPNGFNFTPSTGGVNVNGSRADENSILLDGVQQVRTRSAGVTTGVVNVDTVQEIQILTSNYAPEFGRANGGQTLFVTKSGTKEFHGSIYHFLRNDAFDANTWDRNRTPLTQAVRVAEKPPTIRFNQPGYSIGGPIYIPGKFNTEKDKLFFFWAQEWTRFREQVTVRARVPSVALRNGDLRQDFGPGADGVWGTADDPVKDPATKNADGTGGVGFANGLIPASSANPIGKAIVNAFPLPNCINCFPGSNDNYINTGGQGQNTRKDVLRIDFFHGIHHLSFRGSLFAWDIRGAFRGAFDFTPDNHSRPNRSAGVTLVSTFTPTLINEFTFGASADIVRLGVGGRPSRSALGITYPYIFPGTKELEDKIPTISISNYTDIDGGPYPAFSSGPIYTWTDTITHVRGAHTIKGGINIEYSGQNDFDQINIQQVPGASNNQNGRFEFRDDRFRGSNQAIVDAYLGLFKNYGEIGRKNYTPWRATTFEWFLQDNWKATRNLTLEYGVRYNYWPPWHSLWNNIASFYPQFYQRGLVTLNSAGAIVYNPGVDRTLARFNGISLPGSGFPQEAVGRVEAASNPEFQKLFRGVPEGLSETHKNVFEPRLGIAYAPNEKTTIRAGFGIFHNRVLLNDSSLLGGNAPLQFLVGVENGLASNPAGSTVAEFPFSLTMQDPVFKHPTAYNWSLTIQRELPGNFIVELGYVGKRSLFLPRERNINQLLPGQNFTRDATGKVTGTVPLANALRQYLGHGQIRLSENAANAHYHSFQISANRRFANGFSFDLAYTFSKSIDNASDKRTLLPDAYNDKIFRGRSDFDRPHAFVINYIYELPFGQGKRFLNTGGVLNQIIGGWQLTGISFVRSGTPFSITIPVDALGVGSGSGGQFAQFNGTITQLKPTLGGALVSDLTLFTLPAPGTYGNVSRNTFRNPRFQSHDLALFKKFSVSENTRVEFRMEMFNFINHPNLGGYNINLSDGNAIETSFTSPNYGKFRPNPSGPVTRNFGLITGKSGDRRQIQFGLKFIF